IQNTAGFPPEAVDLAEAIKDADGVLFVTPEYNWSMPGVLKNAIDWVSRMKEQPFEHKPVAIQSCSQGPLGGARMQYHWRMSMTFLGAFIFGTPEVFVGMAQNKFDKDTLELKDQPTKDAVKAQLAAFAKFIVRVRAA
ncbi:MAG TPA: NADPH-dependent FMN reductase, partial [Pseudolabrys sp.]|nr:NADPH-dependent FMN reductase [Pseudolabrys sp.]